MASANPFTERESAIIRAEVLAGRSSPQIVLTLSARGYHRSPHSVRSSRAFSNATVERREHTQPKPVEPPPEAVQFECGIPVYQQRVCCQGAPLAQPVTLARVYA